MRISDRLKKLVEFSGLNLREFSEKVEIPYRTLQDYISGKREPGVANLEKIATHMRVSLNWLILGEGPMFMNGYPPPPSSEAEEKGFPVHTLKRAKFFWQKAHEVVFQGEEVTMIPFEGLIEGQDLLEAYVRQELTDEEVWERMVKILEEWREKLERDVGEMEE